MRFVQFLFFKHALVWGVPKMNSEDKELLKSYGFVNGEDLI